MFSLRISWDNHIAFHLDIFVFVYPGCLKMVIFYLDVTRLVPPFLSPNIEEGHLKTPLFKSFTNLHYRNVFWDPLMHLQSRDHVTGRLTISRGYVTSRLISRGITTFRLNSHATSYKVASHRSDGCAHFPPVTRPPNTAHHLPFYTHWSRDHLIVRMTVMFLRITPGTHWRPIRVGSCQKHGLSRDHLTGRVIHLDSPINRTPLQAL